MKGRCCGPGIQHMRMRGVSLHCSSCLLSHLWWVRNSDFSCPECLALLLLLLSVPPPGSWCLENVSGMLIVVIPLLAKKLKASCESPATLCGWQMRCLSRLHFPAECCFWMCREVFVCQSAFKPCSRGPSVAVGPRCQAVVAVRCFIWFPVVSCFPQGVRHSGWAGL